LTAVLAPDASGAVSNVVLGYDHLEAWVSGKPWINSLIGRNANRIAEGKFSLDGQTYQLEQNNNGNNLHSGAAGWNSKLCKSKAISGTDPKLGDWVGVEMTFHSPDGEDSYPGALDVSTSFRLYGGAVNTLQLLFQAQHAAGETKPTIVNMCNHSYWNLNGSDGRQGILDQHLQVHADATTELDPSGSMLSTGNIAPVEGTPFDFRKPRTIGGEQLKKLDAAIPAPGGYDNNFVLNKQSPPANADADQATRTVKIDDSTELTAPFAARLSDPSGSGRVMDVFTSAPGVQVYSGNFLDGSSVVGRGGVAWPKHAAVCLETQAFPGAINNVDKWKQYNTDPTLRPGQKYNHVVLHRFYNAPKKA